MQSFNYVITTRTGAIPYIIDTDKPFLNKMRKVYLDDVLYKDSLYDKGHSFELQKFIGSSTPVCLGFKEKPSVLKSKRGNYKLKQEAYEKVIESMKISDLASYQTGILKINDQEVVEPNDLDDFKARVKSDSKCFGTEFINKLVDEGKILFIKENELFCKHINETEFEYQKYMYSINEMNAFTFIAETNYKVFYEYFNDILNSSKSD